MDSEMASFGKRLRHLRRFSMMTQAKLAAAAGLNVFTVSALERGRNDPSLRTLWQLVKVLQLNRRELAELLAGEGPLETKLGDLSNSTPKPLGNLTNSPQKPAPELGSLSKPAGENATGGALP